MEKHKKIVTPLKVSVQRKKKDGTFFKDGAMRIGLEVASQGETGVTQWINGWANSPMEIPEENLPIEVKVWNDEKYGWQFELVSLQAQISELRNRLDKLEK